jgi:hypothetical protein
MKDLHSLTTHAPLWNIAVSVDPLSSQGTIRLNHIRPHPEIYLRTVKIGGPHGR